MAVSTYKPKMFRMQTQYLSMFKANKHDILCRLFFSGSLQIAYGASKYSRHRRCSSWFVVETAFCPHLEQGCSRAMPATTILQATTCRISPEHCICSASGLLRCRPESKLSTLKTAGSPFVIACIPCDLH